MAKALKKIPLTKSSTKRPISKGAEKWLGKPIEVLDHGFVYLVDYLGNDESIEQAARVSYGKGTRTTSATRGLIRYLRRHRHTTPFEMVEFKFHAKMPIFVARQWVRHRTANINEYSGRYSILDREFYVPEPEVIASQSTKNRQGREEIATKKEAEAIRQLLIADASRNYESYQYMLNEGEEGQPKNSKRIMLARELARMNLTLNYYTQWYWKIDLHNLMHFLKLRTDAHSQYEIREYAVAMSEIVADAVPLSWEAFEDYEQESVYLSRIEKELLATLIKKSNVNFSEEQVLQAADKIGLDNKRERAEILDKLEMIGILKEE